MSDRERLGGGPGSGYTQPGVVTPEAVVLEFATAGLGSRTAGELLDLLVMYAVAFALTFAVTLLSSATGSTAAVIVGLTGWLVIFVGYPVAMESLWDGRTLGKAALGLRVITVEGAPIRFRHAMIRGVLAVIEIYLFFPIAVVLVFVTKREQRLGDLLAGTIIVRERADRSMALSGRPVSFPPPWGLEAYTASLDVSRLSSEQYGLVRSFLLRIQSFSFDARMSVATRLANAVALELHHTPPPGVQAEPYLVCVASAYQRRGA